MEPEQIQALSNDAFRDLVGEDVRGNIDPKTSKLLRTPLCVHRWHDTLLQIKRNVEFQLASDKAERYSKRLEHLRKGKAGYDEHLQYLAKKERWRSNNIFFKNGVENKIAEAKRILESGDTLKHRVSELQQAIRSHKHIVEHGTEAEAYDADESLWKVLDA